MRCCLALLTLTLAVFSARGDDWPQWLGPKRDGVWREKGIVDRFPDSGLPVRWRTPIGMGYAGPAVAGGKVYIADRVLDQGNANPASGFTRNVVKGKERLLCLDEASGKILWTHEYPSIYEISYPSGPRCTPVVAGGKVWSLGAMGDLLCLDANSGRVVWSKNFVNDFNAPVPVWGFAAHPLLDGNRLICVGGGRDSVAIAFDKETGKVIWKNLSAAEPGYCPPVIFEIAGQRQLIIWHPESVNGLDPETGKVHWSHPWRIASGLSIPMPRLLDGNRLFLTSFYNGATMLELRGDPPAVVWQSKWAKGGKGELPEKTDTLHSIMPTPVIRDGFIYGICSYGELRCLKADTGKRVWESLQATGSAKAGKDRWNNAFLIEHEDRYFLFNEKGDLIIARLSPEGYQEVSRTHVIAPTNTMAPGRPVVWVHPAFANQCMYVRNDREIICVSLAK